LSLNIEYFWRFISVISDLSAALNSQLFPALFSSPGQNAPAKSSFRSCKKTVFFLSLFLFGSV